MPSCLACSGRSTKPWTTSMSAPPPGAAGTRPATSPAPGALAGPPPAGPVARRPAIVHPQPLRCACIRIVPSTGTGVAAGLALHRPNRTAGAWGCPRLAAVSARQSTSRRCPAMAWPGSPWTPATGEGAASDGDIGVEGTRCIGRAGPAWGVVALSQYVMARTTACRHPDRLQASEVIVTSGLSTEAIGRKSAEFPRFLQCRSRADRRGTEKKVTRATLPAWTRRCRVPGRTRCRQEKKTGAACAAPAGSSGCSDRPPMRGALTS